MNDFEYEKISKIIEEESDTNNLLRIKELINDKLVSLNNSNSLNVLNQLFIEFWYENISKFHNRRLKPYVLWRRFSEILDINYSDIKVCDTLKITKEALLEKDGIGPKSIDVYEQMLNLYGLSLDIKISSNLKQEKTSKEDILLKEVRVFCSQNMDKVTLKKNLFKFNKLGYATYFEIKDQDIIDKTSPYDVRVYQTLGMDKDELAHFQNLGYYTIDVYEEMLNLYDLSLDKKLDSYQYNKLKQLHLKQEKDK